jgi:hypothetical protein
MQQESACVLICATSKAENSLESNSVWVYVLSPRLPHEWYKPHASAVVRPHEATLGIWSRKDGPACQQLFLTFQAMHRFTLIGHAANYATDSGVALVCVFRTAAC